MLKFETPYRSSHHRPACRGSALIGAGSICRGLRKRVELAVENVLVGSGERGSSFP
jgi:hypothetical protein